MRHVYVRRLASLQTEEEESITTYPQQGGHNSVYLMPLSGPPSFIMSGVTPSGLIVVGRPTGEHVSIRITDQLDEYWFIGTLEVSVGPWNGCCKASFRRGELRGFAAKVEGLYKDLTGTAELATTEPYLEIKLSGDGKGHFEVKGRARESFTDEAYLAFDFAIDQTELPAIARDLRIADPE